MKKLAVIALALVMALGLAACGSKKAWPDGDTTIICPFSAGGAMDTSARLTAEFLAKQLGVNVEVSNVTGGGKLRLDYKGNLKLTKLTVDGQPLVGEVSAALYPDLVCGPGTALVTPKGLAIILR